LNDDMFVGGLCRYALYYVASSKRSKDYLLPLPGDFAIALNPLNLRNFYKPSTSPPRGNMFPGFLSKVLLCSCHPKEDDQKEQNWWQFLPITVTAIWFQCSVSWQNHQFCGVFLFFLVTINLSWKKWLNFKLFGITYLVGKIKFKLLFQGPLAK